MSALQGNFYCASTVPSGPCAAALPAARAAYSSYLAAIEKVAGLEEAPGMAVEVAPQVWAAVEEGCDVAAEWASYQASAKKQRFFSGLRYGGRGTGAGPNPPQSNPT